MIARNLDKLDWNSLILKFLHICYRGVVNKDPPSIRDPIPNSAKFGGVNKGPHKNSDFQKNHENKGPHWRAKRARKHRAF